jgi:hypothetical protein
VFCSARSVRIRELPESSLHRGRLSCSSFSVCMPTQPPPSVSSTIGAAAAPWLDEAAEVWSAVLQPFRHKGKANYLTPVEPDKFFEPLMAPPPDESPVVVLTSIGFDTDGLDMARVADIALGTGAVRASMTAVSRPLLPALVLLSRRARP